MNGRRADKPGRFVQRAVDRSETECDGMRLATPLKGLRDDRASGAQGASNANGLAVEITSAIVFIP